MIGENVHYFLGCDPAPSEGHKSDDGALAVGRASPRVLSGHDAWVPTENPADWYFDYVFAQRLSWLQKASARQWAGAIQMLHRAFGFTRIVLDPNHGGWYIKRELEHPRLPLNGIETDVTPIVTLDSTNVVQGHFILTIFKRGDPGIEALWEKLKGDDVLNDAMFSEMKLAIAYQQVAWPAKLEDWLDDMPRLQSWAGIKRTALEQLTGPGGMVDQYKSILAATNADGTWALTRNGARQFSAVGKKDFVSAGMMTYVGFRSWLRMGDFTPTPAADAKGFMGWSR